MLRGGTWMLVGELNGGMETKQERTVSFPFVRFTQQYYMTLI